MKQSKGHPARKGRGKKLFNLSLTLFLTVILLFVNGGIASAAAAPCGYKYYNAQTFEVISVSQQKDIIRDTIDKQLNKLEDRGYHIVSANLDFTIFCNQTVIRNKDIRDEQFKNLIVRHLDVDVLATRLKLNNDKKLYYFKTDSECTKFIKELNKYRTQSYSTESDIVSYKQITSKTILDKKISNVKKDAETAARTRITQVTSRGNNQIRTSPTKYNVPMKSYVYISSYYGNRNREFHLGVDFAAPMGTEIYAWKDGVVTTANWNGSYGNFIEIKHSDGTTSRYGHLNQYAISAGQKVSKGQTIGYVGSTGNSTGPHLHLEILVNGTRVNPLSYL